MTEAELLDKVTKLADNRLLYWHHCIDSRKCTGYKGLPDLILVGPEGIIFAELKSDHGETSAEQDMWRWILQRVDNLCRHECERMTEIAQVWDPAKLADGTIEDQLDLIAGTANRPHRR